VFVNMDRDAQPLLDYLDPIPTIFAPFQPEHLRYTFLKAVPMPCNWKTAIDGFLEAYHVPGTHPQLHRDDRSNLNLISMAELERRGWSPTTVYERTANYASVGRKKGQLDAKKDPSRRPIDESRVDPRMAVAMSVQYIYTDMKALETERSYRAAEELKTADVPEGMSAGEYFMELYREYSLREGYDWPEITAEQWAAAGTAWHIFPNSILLPNQGSFFMYRARPNGLDPDSCIFELGGLHQVPVAEYDKPHDFEPQYFDDYRQADLGVVWEQDLGNAENVTVGMHSPSFDGHRLSTAQEMTIWNHHRVADRYLWNT
jgi:phenylpropionate dioxygenase-like ring-hydroxylating dioxygenase large terminal subunit